MKHTEQGWMEPGAFGGATLDRIAREEIPQWTEGGNQVRIWGTAKEMGAGSWWSRVSGCEKLGMQGGNGQERVLAGL